MRFIPIFKKDVAHLWPQILVFVAALVAFACSDPTYISPRDVASFINFLFIALPLSCWLLVASLIQQEKPIGDEQYWLTRPFSLVDLLGAKALFLMLFVIAPVFICQAIVLSVVPQSPGLNVGALLAKGAFLLAWYVLPTAAVAAVTKNLGHALLGSLLVLMALGLFMEVPSRSGWNGLAWIREMLAAIVAFCGSVTVIYLQYTRRRTVLSRGCLAGAAVLLAAALALPPLQAAFVMQSWLSKERVDPQAVRITLASWDDAYKKPIYEGGPRVDLQIPVELQNVPANQDIEGDWIFLESPWRFRWSGKAGLTHFFGRRSLDLEIQTSEFLRLKDQPIRVRGLVDLTLVASSTSQCRGGDLAEDIPEVYCLWNPQVFSPFPTSPWFGPLQKYDFRAASHPVAHIQRSFDLGPLRLAGYVEMK